MVVVAAEGAAGPGDPLGAGDALAVAAAAGPAAVPLLSQVMEKALPSVIADGVASVTPPAETMVSPAAFALPSGAWATAALLKFTVPSLDSGSTLLASLGASAMISAEPSWAAADVWLVVCVQVIVCPSSRDTPARRGTVRFP